MKKKKTLGLNCNVLHPTQARALIYLKRSDLVNRIRRKMEITIAPQSRKIKPHNGEEIPCLPAEIIIEEILPRLPVKSLLKFRCVSKSWCSLIASKRFMKSHLRNSNNSSSFTHHRIFFDTIVGFKQCSLPSLFNEPLTGPFTCNSDFGINIQKGKVHLVGCCNGLVCVLVDRKRFILWNPTTKRFNNLPNFDYKTNHASITKYGFGFDELNDDFKVFGLLSVFCTSGKYLPIRKVYSLRANSWEVVLEGRDASPFDGAGIFASGKLHWDICSAYTSGVASFDLNSKVYGVIELPSYSKNEFSQRVGVLKGCLSLHSFRRKSHVDIWVMKEYGLKESWDKVATVPYYQGPHDCSLPTPLTIGPNGEILLIYKSTFLIYNPEGNVFRIPQITDAATKHFLDSGIYIESLASVVPYAKQEK